MATGRGRDRRRPVACFCAALVGADHGRGDGYCASLWVDGDCPCGAVAGLGYCWADDDQGYGLRDGALDSWGSVRTSVTWTGCSMG
jgi:hypothetical protein